MEPAKPDPISAEQARQNRSTQSQWGMYATHRGQIERLIVPAEPGRRGRICVLGAGNCNDLDLKWLAEVYREVHLVDLDPAALRGAVQRQKVNGVGAIQCHAPIDLTGIAPEVARWAAAKAPPGLAEVQSAAAGVAGPAELPGLGRFEVVLSPCVLTQMMNPIRDALCGHYPPSHPARSAVRSALRLRHLRTLANHLAPGGRAALVIDLISSEKFGELPRIPADRLKDFMRSFVADAKAYPGLDPQGLAAAWREDPELCRQLTPPRFSAPWVWHLGLRKSFLVYAATFHDRRTV